MARKIIDLDAMVPEDLEFKLNGKTYFVPGDLNLTMQKKLLAIGEKMTKEPSEKSVDEMANFLSDMFSLREDNPKGPLKITLVQMRVIMQSISDAMEEVVGKNLPFTGKSSTMQKHSAAARSR